MKVIRIIFLVFALVFANVYVAQAEEPSPPAPGKTSKMSSTEDEDGETGPGIPEGPIDQDLVFLMMAGLVFGTVFIYKNKIKKASM